MTRFNKKAFEPLDQEEKELMEAIEKDDWQPVKNMNKEKETAIQAARNTLKKDKRINLRLSQKDKFFCLPPNYIGNCCAYALAKVAGEPLLFKGNDFSKTDIAFVSY